MHPHPKWLQALGNTRNGAFVVDANQHILTWNNAMENLLGYSASEVLNRQCYEGIGGRLPSGRLWCRSKCDLQRCVRQGGLVRDFDLLASTKQGREIWVNVSIIRLPRKDRPLTLHLLREATRQQKGQRALEDFLDVLRSSGLLRRTQGRQRERPVPSTPSSAPLSKRFAGLSHRELEVLRLLTEGIPTKRVAAALGISEVTVRSHVRNIFKKCGLHSRVEAVSLAVKAGLF